MVFRKRAGMIWSVSMLLIGSGTMRLSKLSEWLHRMVLTSVTTPVMALAAAVSGLARKVRPPLPCRPSKLRLLVETLYSPGLKLIAIHGDAHGAAGLAPFAAGGAEDLGQAFGDRPGASLPCEPGTTITRTFGFTLRPLRMRGGGAQIGDARIGAAADEDHVDGMAQRAACRLRAPCSAAPSRRESRSQRIGRCGRVRERRR